MLYYRDALLLETKRKESLKTMRDVCLQAGQELSARIKVDCLIVAWYLINRNLSMIGK